MSTNLAKTKTLSAGRPTLYLLAFAQLVIALDYNIVFVALPKIGTALPFGTSGLQWVVSAYAVVFGGFLLLGGRLADLFGKRTLFMAGLLCYAVASLAGGLATAPWMLVVARGVQGLGGALLSPATLALVSTLFTEGNARTKAISTWAAAGSTGMVLGSLLGGVLAGSLGWRSVFFVNVPLAAVAALLAIRVIPADSDAGGSERLDSYGASLATIGVLSVVYGMVEAPTHGWLSMYTLASIALGIVLIVLFLSLERRVDHPLVPLHLFSNPELRSGTLTTFLFMASFGAIPYFVTLYLQDIAGVSALVSGFVFILPSACVLCGTVMGGRLSVSHSIRSLLTWSWIIGIGLALVMAWCANSRASLWLAAVPFAILSIAQGVVFTLMFALSTSTSRAENQGVASGIATAGQQVGGAVGLAILVAVASEFSGHTSVGTSVHLVTYGLTGVAILMSLGLLVALSLRPTRELPSGHPEEFVQGVEVP